jgi:hypothetical protein
VCDIENLVIEKTLAHWGAVAPKTNKADPFLSEAIFDISLDVRSKT